MNPPTDFAMLPVAAARVEACAVAQGHQILAVKERLEFFDLLDVDLTEGLLLAEQTFG